MARTGLEESSVLGFNVDTDEPLDSETCVFFNNRILVNW
jgi:hypothetical protein